MTRLDRLLSNSKLSTCSVLSQFDKERKQTVAWNDYMDQFSRSLCRGSGYSCYDCPAKRAHVTHKLLGFEPDE